MVTEKAISRELMGKIVDEVFDGAIEDASVIEEIYACIKRHELSISASEPAWWIVTTDMGKVIFHGPDKDRADRVAAIHGREAQALYDSPPALSAQVQDVPADKEDEASVLRAGIEAAIANVDPLYKIIHISALERILAGKP